MRQSHLPPSSAVETLPQVMQIAWPFWAFGRHLNHGITTRLGLWLCGQIADGTNARGPWEMRPAQRITAPGLNGCER